MARAWKRIRMTDMYPHRLSSPERTDGIDPEVPGSGVQRLRLLRSRQCRDERRVDAQVSPGSLYQNDRFRFGN